MLCIAYICTLCFNCARYNCSRVARLLPSPLPCALRKRYPRVAHALLAPPNGPHVARALSSRHLRVVHALLTPCAPVALARCQASCQARSQAKSKGATRRAPRRDAVQRFKRGRKRDPKRIPREIPSKQTLPILSHAHVTVAKAGETR